MPVRWLVSYRSHDKLKGLQLVSVQALEDPTHPTTLFNSEAIITRELDKNVTFLPTSTASSVLLTPLS